MNGYLVSCVFTVIHEPVMNILGTFYMKCLPSSDYYMRENYDVDIYTSNKFDMQLTIDQMHGLGYQTLGS